MKMGLIKHILIGVNGCLFILIGTEQAYAQKDTTKNQVVDITSAYKPVLRNAVKVNFSASNLIADTSRQVMPYQIPPQNLFYTYRPIPIKPLALDHDTTLSLGNRNFLKLGYGNLSTPFARINTSFGNGKQYLINVDGNYISSKGTILNQDRSIFNLAMAGSYFQYRKEFYGAVSFKQEDDYSYGYDHGQYDFKRSDLLNRFQHIHITAGMRNTTGNNWGISYDPHIQASIFTNKPQGITEHSLMAEIPVEKLINDHFAIKLSVKADLTAYKNDSIHTLPGVNNNIVTLAPVIIYTQPAYKIYAGVSPAWDNGQLVVLPDFYLELPLKGKPFLLEAGWVGRIEKNSFEHLAAINPYLKTAIPQLNTRETELYGGIKTSVGKHFNFSAKAGILTDRNLPFFINDTLSGKSFYISNETKTNILRLHADLSYINQDQFTITGGFTFNGYTGMEVNKKAWGTIPVEITASMRWRAFKQLLFKSDFKAFTGGPYLLNNNVVKSLSGGADLSGGVEFMINKKFSAWADINNIFNNRYERWHNYPVYGLNVLAGLILKF